jgi:catechol 2,3-dioxygenase-like lactoylglutathione lyase family enzyme
MAGQRAAQRPVYTDLHDSYNMSGWHHPGFSVDSVDAVIDELKRRDVTIASEPYDVPAMGLRVAFFADPWGNLFEVIQSITQYHEWARRTS